MATADAALDPARWARATVAQILPVVIRFLVAVYRERCGLIRVFVIRNHSDPAFRARQIRLSNYVYARVRDLLVARSDEIVHPEPERAVRFALILVFSALENVLLFGDTRSSSLTLSDDEFADELTRANLAYLGVTSPTE